LDATYDAILSKLPDQDRNDAERLLEWLSYSAESLSVKQLAEVIVVDLEAEGGPVCDTDRRYQPPEKVLTVCSGFVTISESIQLGQDGCESACCLFMFFSIYTLHILVSRKREVVTLAHFSVKEYFVSRRIRLGFASNSLTCERLSHSWISQACIAYLMQFNTSSSISDATPKSSPLALYAVEYWIIHAKNADYQRTSDIPDPFLTFLQENTPPFQNWVHLSISLIEGRYRYDWDKNKMLGTKNITPLHYTAQHGHQMLCHALLEHGADVNARGGDYENALQAASYSGHEGIVKFLVEKGADVNAQGGQMGNALQAASFADHEGIVKLLVDTGANVNAQGGVFGNALQAASCRGREGIVRFLVEKGADVNCQGGGFGSALEAAKENEHHHISKFLMEHGTIDEEVDQSDSEAVVDDGNVSSESDR